MTDQPIFIGHYQELKLPLPNSVLCLHFPDTLLQFMCYTVSSVLVYCSGELPYMNAVLWHQLSFDSPLLLCWMGGMKLCVSFPGAGYDDSTEGQEKNDDAVFPGGYYEYVWDISPNDGPTTNDPECLTYSYSSQVDTVRDVNSGLIGALLICTSSQCVCVCWGGARERHVASNFSNTHTLILPKMCMTVTTEQKIMSRNHLLT